MSNLWLWIILGVCLLALLFVVYNYIVIKRMPEGTDRMIKMSAIIREGSNVFIKKEFTTIAIVIAVLAVLFTLFIEKFSGITYILGATMSSIVCILGMKSATYANVRTIPNKPNNCTLKPLIEPPFKATLTVSPTFSDSFALFAVLTLA